MGSWSEWLDKLFFEKYGYDLLDYLPCVIDSPRFPVTTEEQRRAKTDYIMLCCDLVRENYFAKMKKWLNKNGILSVGHLDLDHTTLQSRVKRYGNSLKMLRVDVLKIFYDILLTLFTKNVIINKNKSA